MTGSHLECRQCQQVPKHCECTFPDFEIGPRKNIFQELHDSEINGRISSFYDGLWRAELGDEMNGFTGHCDADTYDGAEAALAAMAVQQYPNSEFAKRRLISL